MKVLVFPGKMHQYTSSVMFGKFGWIDILSL